MVCVCRGTEFPCQRVTGDQVFIHRIHHPNHVFLQTPDPRSPRIVCDSLGSSALSVTFSLLPSPASSRPGSRVGRVLWIIGRRPHYHGACHGAGTCSNHSIKPGPGDDNTAATLSLAPTSRFIIGMEQEHAAATSSLTRECSCLKRSDVTFLRSRYRKLQAPGPSTPTRNMLPAP